ncbi:Uncharacterised protein [Chromobacterium vaccinii]|nr:Uncharacterised protein [Chromobacterium vaccinii]
MLALYVQCAYCHELSDIAPSLVSMLIFGLCVQLGKGIPLARFHCIKKH